MSDHTNGGGIGNLQWPLTQSDRSFFIPGNADEARHRRNVQEALVRQRRQTEPRKIFPKTSAPAPPGTKEGKPNRRKVMLWTIFVILLVAWLLGLVSSYTLGGFIHILLVLAIVVLIINLVSGRRGI
jgi:hypothetical protein